MQKDMEITALRNITTIYRTIACQLWGKQKVAEGVLEKSSKAETAIEGLAKTLVRMREDLKLLKKAHAEVSEDWGKMREQMKVMLGDAWDRFDREAEGHAERD
jgi:hypothetical protein